MNIIHKINFDEEGIYDETFYFDGQEITEEQFLGLEEDLKDDDFECGTEEPCCDCNCTDCEEVSRHPYDVIAEEVNEIMEMVENGACDDCLSHKLMSFFMIGVDMGLQGVFARKE